MVIGGVGSSADAHRVLPASPAPNPFASTALVANVVLVRHGPDAAFVIATGISRLARASGASSI